MSGRTGKAIDDPVAQKWGAQVNVSGNGSSGLGGLVGENDYGTIKYSCARGNVTGNGRGAGFGGLAGRTSGVITECYATGSVVGR
ncbi:MAG: hypothetical protein JSW66_04920, partial [Phycisphaerales bacterium]